MFLKKANLGLLALGCILLTGCPGNAINRVEDFSDFKLFEFRYGPGFVFLTENVLARAAIQHQADGQYQFQAALLTVNPPEAGEVRDSDGLLHLPPRILTEDEVARMLLVFSHVEMHAAFSFQPCPTDQSGYDFRWDDFAGVDNICTSFGDQIVNDPSIQEIFDMLYDFWQAGA